MTTRGRPEDVRARSPGVPGGPPAASRKSVTTMRDVAEATGVSQSTVSRVLTGAATTVPIAVETRLRVVDAAQRLGYRPNPLARGLRGARTMLLGVIVREITDPFFAGAIEAVSIEASLRGYNVVLGHAHGHAAEAIALWGVLEARHCDAIILLGDMRDQPRLIEDLRGASIPIVALWQGSRSADIPSVDVDNRAGMLSVLRHLAELGHRRIAFIGGRRLGDIRDREDAFREFMADHPEDASVEYASNDLEGGADALGRLLDQPRPPTAVAASTDVLALGALHRAYTRGIRVPDDLSVTGFDDIPFAAAAIPALTTVRMPVREMVATAVRFVFDEPRDGTTGRPPHPLLIPSMVCRSSTGPARRF